LRSPDNSPLVGDVVKGRKQVRKKRREEEKKKRKIKETK